ncbi:hypothetical protein HMPREF3157_03405 [Dermabacter sp. HMSC06F07]|nr:hypothetical protein HMPREF3157_03405 [Dermabacter sp. HMSC06F07]
MAAGLGRITILCALPLCLVVTSCVGHSPLGVLRDGEWNTALMRSPLTLASFGSSGFGVRGRARRVVGALR